MTVFHTFHGGAINRHTIPALLGAACAVLLMSSNTAFALPSVGPNVRVSPPPSAHWIKNASAEASIAIDPANPDNVIATYAHYAYLDCDQNALDQTTCHPESTPTIAAVRFSTDGGLTWSPEAFLQPDPSKGVQQLFGDVLVIYGPRPLPGGGFAPLTGRGAAARAYLFTMANLFTLPTTAEVMYYSDDHGHTWVGPVVVSSFVASKAEHRGTDRPEADAMTDQGSPNYGRLLLGYAYFNGFSFRCAVQTSDDGGLTWSHPQQVGNANHSGFPCKVAAGPNNRAYLVTEFYNSSNAPGAYTGGTVAVAASDDGGKQFSVPVDVGPAPQAQFPGSDLFYRTTFDALPGSGAREYGGTSPWIAISPTTGKIIVTFNSFSYDPGNGHVHGVLKFGASTDEGRTWSVPDAPLVDIPGYSVVTPTASVDSTGNKVFMGFLLVQEHPVGTPQGADTEQEAAFILSYDGGEHWTGTTLASSEASNSSAGFRRNLATGFLGEFVEGKFDAQGNIQFTWTDTRNGANCPAYWNFVNAGGLGTMLPFNFVKDCLGGVSTNFVVGNTDIYVAKITP